MTPRNFTSASEAFGARGRQGARGEAFYVSSLERYAAGRWRIFPSLSVPGMRTDVDLAVANGDSVVLIDVKAWKGGHLWSFPVGTQSWMPMDGLTPYIKPDSGTWGRLSRNMVMALDRYGSLLPGTRLSAMVVFVPTRGRDLNSVPDSVEFLFWPGLIRSFLSGPSAAELEDRLGSVEEDVPASIVRQLTSLQRR